MSNAIPKSYCCVRINPNKENDSKMPNSPKNDKKFRREMAVFGGNGSFTAVSYSSIFTCLWRTSYQRRTLKLSNEDCYTKVLKTTASNPPSMFDLCNFSIKSLNHSLYFLISLTVRFLIIAKKSTILRILLSKLLTKYPPTCPDKCSHIFHYIKILFTFKQIKEYLIVTKYLFHKNISIISVWYNYLARTALEFDVIFHAYFRLG